MLILAVDTSSKNCSLSLLRDDDVLDCIGGASDEPYASRLFADVQRVLGPAGIQLPQIELFAVATGPGSFTGLRVGLAAVMGWSEALNRPIAPVSVLEAVASQVDPSVNLIAPMIDARGGQIFGGLLRRDDSEDRLRFVGEEAVLTPQEYFTRIAGEAPGESPVFASTTPESAGLAIAASPFAGSRLQEVSSELAPWIGRLGLARSRRGEVVDAVGLQANYVRRSDAEMKWRGV
jgi:tRNA threonylcarbamoyladenosine biosynthesis protein TsaB